MNAMIPIILISLIMAQEALKLHLVATLQGHQPSPLSLPEAAGDKVIAFEYIQTKKHSCQSTKSLLPSFSP